MRKGISSKLVLFLAAIALFACKAKKPFVAQLPPEKPQVIEEPLVISSSRPENTVSVLRDTIALHQLDFRTLSFKAKGSLSVNGKENDVTMNIRIDKDKAIWVSITAIAGLKEIARALITQDSIKIINRLQEEYLAQPISYIYRLAGKEANFSRIQAIFAGNVLPALPDEKSTISSREGQTLLSGKLNQVTYAISLDKGYKVTRLELIDPDNGQSLMAQYSDFSPENNLRMHHQMLLQSAWEINRVKMDLSYSKVSLNEPVEMPFTVPKRFTLSK